MLPKLSKFMRVEKPYWRKRNHRTESRKWANEMSRPFPLLLSPICVSQVSKTRDVHETFWAETRRCSFRDGGRDLEAPETLVSLGSFNVSPKRFLWRMVKHIDNKKKLYGIINSHHGKLFLFVILWVFALHFDNYRWIINGLHHEELQLQCCRHCLLYTSDAADE